MSNKLYCYVDESGQDTKGAFFVVAIVFAEEDTEQLKHICLEIEKLSGKGMVKWREAKNTRLEYIRLILRHPAFLEKVAYATYVGNSTYEDLTIQTIALAVKQTHQEFQKTILVDGLPKEKWIAYGTRIRKYGAKIWKVRGVRYDENDPLIRLADAICGLVRAAYYGQVEMQALLDRALQDRTIVNLLH